MLRQIEWWVNNGAITKNGVLPVTTSFFWRFCFSLRTSYKELIWCTNNPNVQLLLSVSAGVLFASAFPRWVSLTLASGMAVLHGKDVFLILMLSTKNGIPVIWKSFFQKICFKVKVLKTFYWLSHKTCRFPKRRAIFKIPSSVFYKNLCSFCWL